MFVFLLDGCGDANIRCYIHPAFVFLIYEETNVKLGEGHLYEIVIYFIQCMPYMDMQLQMLDTALIWCVVTLF